jgi:hypothetical protein
MNMNKGMLLSIFVVLMGFCGAASAWGGHHHHGGGSFGIYLGAPAPYYYPPSYYNPPSYYYPPAYYAPPVYAQPPPQAVYSQPAPPVYIERSQAANYWYYCTSPAGYYPYVKKCPVAWLKVIPQQTPTP